MDLGCYAEARSLDHPQAIRVSVERAVILNTVGVNLQDSIDAPSVSHDIRQGVHPHVEFQSVKPEHLHNDLSLSRRPFLRLSADVSSCMNV